MYQSKATYRIKKVERIHRSLPPIAFAIRAQFGNGFEFDDYLSVEEAKTLIERLQSVVNEVEAEQRTAAENIKDAA